MQARIQNIKLILNGMLATAPEALITDNSLKSSTNAINNILYDAKLMGNCALGEVADVILLEERLTRIQRDYLRSISEDRKLFSVALTTDKKSGTTTKEDYIYSPYVSLFTKKDMTDLLARLDSTPAENLVTLLTECEMFISAAEQYQSSVISALNQKIEAHLKSAEDMKIVRLMMNRSTGVEQTRLAEAKSVETILSTVSTPSSTTSAPDAAYQSNSFRRA